MADTNNAAAAEALERMYQAPEIVRQRLMTLDALRPRRGEHILDAGCGPGLLLQALAAGVGRDGQVTGLDSDPAMLALASARCADLPQVRVTAGALECLPLPAAAFDALSCTQVLLYTDPLDTALAELARVLKPGGRAAIIETDWRGLVLGSADTAFTRRVCDAWDASVANPNLPVRLAGLLSRHGLDTVRVEAIPLLSTNYVGGSYAVGMVKSMAQDAVRAGAVTDEAAQAWLEDLARRGRAGDWFFCINRFLFTAVRRLA